MKYAIYDTITGAIQGFMSGPPKSILADCREGEEFYLNCPMDTTHIIDNEPVTIITPPTTEELLRKIRFQRDQRLSSCDWTQMPDSPIPSGKRFEWAEYRQALRDFPETCDVENPVWPVVPN